MNKELISLGYRKAKPGVWAKPVGQSFFTYEEDSKLWTNWFKSIDQQMYIWHSAKYEDEQKFGSIKNWIIYQETFTRVNVGTRSDFSFLTLEESCSL